MLWIAGNIKKETPTIDTPRLYHAYAVVNGFKGYDRVVLNLVCTGRRIHFNFYDQVVQNFSGLCDEEKLNIKKSVGLLFSEEETQELRIYFKKRYGYVLQALGEPIPIQYEKYSGGTDSLSLSGCGIWKVNSEDDYPLPFKVTAYYDLRGALPVMVDDDDDDYENGSSITLDKIVF